MTEKNIYFSRFSDSKKKNFQADRDKKISVW